MRKMPKVFDTDYILHDNNGIVSGIKDDAPDWAKCEFNQFMKLVEAEPDKNGNVKVCQENIPLR